MSVATARPTAESPSKQAALPRWAGFAEAFCAALGLRLEFRGDGAAVFGPELTDESARHEPPRRWPGARLSLRRQAPKEPTPAAPLLETDSAEAVLAWLGERAIHGDRVPAFVPAGDPQAVHEIAERLFSAYQIDGGAIHLGGCHLEPTPIIRLSGCKPGGVGGVSHRYFRVSGEELSPRLAAELGLDEVAPPPAGESITDRAPWRPAIAAATGAVGREQPAPLVASLVMVNDTRGQLLVEIGEESVAVAFGGWARTLTAPAATCPATGVTTFHLAATSDGRIAAAEQIATCEVTGSRLLLGETVVCSVTGKRVSADRCRPCSVTGEPTLPQALVTCPRCNQRVSRVVLEAGGCRGCRRLERAEASDPRLAAVLAAAPGMVASRRWRVAETHTAWIAEGGGLLRRVLVVVDKKTRQLLHAAERRRPFGAWTAVAGAASECPPRVAE